MKQRETKESSNHCQHQYRLHHTAHSTYLPYNRDVLENHVISILYIKTGQLHPLALIISRAAEVSKIKYVNTHDHGKKQHLANNTTDYICRTSNHKGPDHKSAPDKLPQQAASCQLSWPEENTRRKEFSTRRDLALNNSEAELWWRKSLACVSLCSRHCDAGVRLSSGCPYCKTWSRRKISVPGGRKWQKWNVISWQEGV